MKNFTSIFYEKSIYDDASPEKRIPKFDDMIAKIDNFCKEVEKSNYDKKYADQAKKMLTSAKNRFESVSDHTNNDEIAKAKASLSKLSKIESKCRLNGASDKLGDSLSKATDKILDAGKKKNESTIFPNLI